MISKRLQYIIDIMPFLDVVADIGTDHGYIPVQLIKKLKANRAVAADISYMSLKKAKDYIKHNKLDEIIDTRVGNGMSVLDVDEVDGLVIAGMGGVLISKIIDDTYNDKFISKKPVFVLQPVQQVKELRYYLYENKFEILDEHILEDNKKIYHIIISKKSENIDYRYKQISKNKDVYLEFGIINIEKKSDLLSDIIKNNINKTKLLIDKLKNKAVDDSHTNLLIDKIKCMEDVYNETWGNI